MPDIFSTIQSLLRPEMGIFIPFCYMLGKSLKTTERIDNRMIPIVLMTVGACLGAIYIVALEPQNGFLSMIVGFMQGAVAGFASTGLYESKRNTLG